MSKTPHNILSERQLNLCEYGGAFGILLSLTCLIQHLIVTVDNWITQLMTPYYIIAIIVFFFLAFKKTIAPILLIISAVLSIIVLMTWIKHQAFSAVVTGLFLYHVIIIIALYVEQVPSKLKERKRLEREEENNWAGKI